MNFMNSFSFTGMFASITYVFFGSALFTSTDLCVTAKASELFECIQSFDPKGVNAPIRIVGLFFAFLFTRLSLEMNMRRKGPRPDN